MTEKKVSHRCLLTYGASGKNITREMFFENDKIEVDECYTLTQRDLKYTLLHFKRRVFRSTMTSWMCHMDEKHGIKSTSVFGYLAVSMGDDIDEHPGMALIVDALNSGSQALECWLAEGTVRENPRSLLFDYLAGIPLELMSRPQLLNHVKRQESKIAEYKAQIEEMTAITIQVEQLQLANTRLNLRLQTQLRIFARAGRSHELPPPSP